MRIGTPPTAGPARIEQAYRNAFLCDCVVDARSDVPEGPEGTGTESITLRQLREDTGYEGIEAGLPAVAVYGQLWNEDFRWQARDRPEVVIPATDDPALELFVAMCFGRFAPVGELADLEGEYRRAFAANRLTITPATILDGGLRLTQRHTSRR